MLKGIQTFYIPIEWWKENGLRPKNKEKRKTSTPSSLRDLTHIFSSKAPIKVHDNSNCSGEFSMSTHASTGSYASMNNVDQQWVEQLWIKHFMIKAFPDDKQHVAL